VFEAYNVTINNKPILNITRTQNGSDHQDAAIRKELDKFQIYFRDGTSEERGAFIANYGTSQSSELPHHLKVGFLRGEDEHDSPRTTDHCSGSMGCG
jgi:hypothetical protein